MCRPFASLCGRSASQVACGRSAWQSHLLRSLASVSCVLPEVDLSSDAEALPRPRLVVDARRTRYEAHVIIAALHVKHLEEALVSACSVHGCLLVWVRSRLEPVASKRRPNRRPHSGQGGRKQVLWQALDFTRRIWVQPRQSHTTAITVSAFRSVIICVRGSQQRNDKVFAAHAVTSTSEEKDVKYCC